MRTDARLVSIAAAGILALLACQGRDTSGPPSPERTAGAVVGGTLAFKDMAGYPVDVVLRQATVDEVELAVQQQEGKAFVGLKAPGSPRSGAAGYRAAVPAAVGSKGMDAVLATGAEVINFYDAVDIAMVRLPPGAVRLLDASPFVDFVEPAENAAAIGAATRASDGAAPAGRVSGFPAPEASLSEVTPWGVSQVNAPAAWSRSTGSGAKVMLMGSGIIAHFDNPAVPVGNCGGLLNACSSYWENGTVEMGSMLARENGQGVIGVAKGVSASDVYAWRVVDDNNYIDFNAEYSGLNQAISYGIKLVLTDFNHLSSYQTESNLFAQLWNSGGVTVAALPAASIRRDTIWPASYGNVVGVSGVTDGGQFAANVPGCTSWPGSDYGPMVDLAGAFWAYTTFANNQGQQWFADSRADYGWCGNYIAAAHVAGVFALVQAYHPSWTPTQVVSAVKGTASNAANPNQQIGYGIPNADAALSYTPWLTVGILGPTSVKPDVYCTWSATVSGGSAPYIYTWTQDGSWVGGESSVYLYTGGGTFTLRVDVSDAGGLQGYSQKSVTVNSSARICPQ